MAQRQENFFGPVIEALVARQNVIAQKQAQQQRQQEIELRKKALEQQAKRDEAYLKQAEASDKIRRLQQGQELFALKEAQIDAVTGTPEKSAKRNIPGAGVITENPILQNILQQRGIQPQDSGIMVRGQENAPVNLDIPDLTGEGVQASIPLGTTQELLAQRLANQATRRQEEERQLQLAGQSENLKSRARAAGAFPFQQALAQQKNRQAIDLEQYKQENRKEIAELRGNFQLEAAKQRAANKTATNAADLSSIAYEIGTGLQPLTGAFKDKVAVTNVLHSQGWVTPPKDLPKAVDVISGSTSLLGKVDSFINMVGEQFNPRLNEAGRQVHQFFTGSNEIVNFAKTLEVDGTAVMKQMGETGMLSNKDIERGMGLIPKGDIDLKSNVRRGELLRAMFEIGINNKVRGLPESQKKAIFEQYDIPFRVLSKEQIQNRYKEIDSFLEGKQTESAPAKSSVKAEFSSDGKFVTLNGERYPVGTPTIVNGRKVILGKKSDGTLGYKDVQ